jgi:hypothetical protein
MLIIKGWVINMNETKLRAIAQLQDFLKATPQVSFSGVDEKKMMTKDSRGAKQQGESDHEKVLRLSNLQKHRTRPVSRTW